MLYYPDVTLSNLSETNFAYLFIEYQAHVLTITLNRPEKKNAMNSTFMRELVYALSIAKYDPNVWIIKFKANGSVFCAGADLKTFAGEPDEPNSSSVPVFSGEILLGDVVQQIGKPTITILQAPVFAGGFLIVGGCHFVIAADHMQFSLPEIRRGIFPMQVMASLIDTASPKEVLRLCLTGESISSAEAKNLGIISHSVPANQVQNVSDELIEILLKGSPKAQQAGIKMFNELGSLDIDSRHAVLKKALDVLLQTHDAHEGLAAFKEKRLPNWTGQ